MAGNKIGGAKAKAKNLEKNPNFYSDLGKIGGKVKGTLKGFAGMSPEKRSLAGKKGGSISRRGKAKIREEVTNEQTPIQG